MFLLNVLLILKLTILALTNFLNFVRFTLVSFQCCIMQKKEKTILDFFIQCIVNRFIVTKKDKSNIKEVHVTLHSKSSKALCETEEIIHWQYSPSNMAPRAQDLKL